MSHVQIRIGRDDADDRGAQVVVDGVDITKAVLADGFAIDITDYPKPSAVVTMRLRVDRLDMDLPESVLNVIETTEV